MLSMRVAPRSFCSSAMLRALLAIGCMAEAACDFAVCANSEIWLPMRLVLPSVLSDWVLTSPSLEETSDDSCCELMEYLCLPQVAALLNACHVTAPCTVQFRF